MKTTPSESRIVSGGVIRRTAKRGCRVSQIGCAIYLAPAFEAFEAAYRGIAAVHGAREF